MKPQICSQYSSPGCCCSQQKPQPIILPRLESTEGVCKMGAKFLTAKHKIYIRNTLVRGEDSHSPGVLPEYICPVSSPVLLLTLYILFLLAFTDSSGKVRWVWVPPLSWHIAKCVCFGVLLPFWLLLYLFIFFFQKLQYPSVQRTSVMIWWNSLLSFLVCTMNFSMFSLYVVIKYSRWTVWQNDTPYGMLSIK